MASSTVLRVKRRLEENPQDALVLMCKRKKTDTEEVSPSLFVFRGTVENQETSHIHSIVPKTDVKLQSIPNVQDVIAKLRKERKEQSSVSRYKVINYRRGLDSTDLESPIDLVDLQKAHDDENDAQYAYDLYISAKKDFDVSMLDNLVSIEHYETDLILGTNNNDSSDEADDDDDSNDENNWRNEYPDSEKSSINEDDMVRAMERVDLEDLSSDEGEDNIYDKNYSEDVTRYGEAYAKYKARVMTDQPELAGAGLLQVARAKMDEESVDGYKDDSDDGFYYGQDEDGEQFREQYASDHSDHSPD